MNLKLSKTEAQNQIKKFFSEPNSKSPKEIEKIKKLAMNKKISLQEYRKLFCKNCLTPFSGNEKIRIKNNSKSVECKFCGEKNRWKIK